MISRREFLKNTGLLGLGMGLICSGSACDYQAEAKRTLKEALYYTRRKNGTVRCNLCPHSCEISDGQWGFCRTRTNRNGRLYSMAYGKPVALHVDPIEKKPFYHYLPGTSALSLGTAGCNLRCSFCQNWEISQANPESIPSYNAGPELLAKMAKEKNTPTIACTYTEPVVFYEYTRDIAISARKVGINTVMVSAGYINPGPLTELCKNLKAVKIDLKGFTDSFYNEMTGGTLKPVLDSLLAVRKQGIWLEIVNLVIPGKNDSLREIRAMCRWIRQNLGNETPLHFSRFIPLYRLTNVPPTPARTLENCRNIAMAEGLKYVYVGNLPGHPGNNTICPSCGKVIIKRIGYRAETTGLKNGKCSHCGRKISGIWS